MTNIIRNIGAESASNLHMQDKEKFQAYVRLFLLFGDDTILISYQKKVLSFQLWVTGTKQTSIMTHDKVITWHVVQLEQLGNIREPRIHSKIVLLTTINCFQPIMCITRLITSTTTIKIRKSFKMHKCSTEKL